MRKLSSTNATTVTLDRATLKKFVARHRGTAQQPMLEWLEITEGRNDATGYSTSKPAQAAKTNVRIDAGTYQAMKVRAAEMGVTVAMAIRFAIEFAVELDEAA